MSPVPVETEAFSWTNNPVALNNPIGFINSKINGAAEGNCDAKVGRQGNNLEAGLGFYTAGDPFNSMEYGRYLVVVPIKVGIADIADVRKLGSFSSEFDKAILSSASGIFYDFGGFNFVGGNAIVFRNTSALNMKKVRVINTDRIPEPLIRHGIFREESDKVLYESLFTQFGDHRDLLASLAGNIGKLQGKDKNEGSENEQDYLTLLAAVSDMRPLNGAAQTVFSKIDTMEIKTKLPYCAGLYEKFNNPEDPQSGEKVQNLCLDGYFAALHFALGHMKEGGYQFASGWPDESLTSQEVRNFLILSKQIPAESQSSEFSALAKELIQQIKSSGALPIVQSLIGPIKSIKKEFEKTSFSTWN